LPETQGGERLPGILASIVEAKREALGALRSRAAALEAAAARAAAPRDFHRALARAGRVSLIAECKRRSPGAGQIRPDLDPARLAAAYARAGASAVSVLTDDAHFGGSNDDLASARDAVDLPVLRKDFTLDPLHVLEARAAGADAVLLIVRILSDESLSRLDAYARGLGMAALVEVHDRQELERAVAVGARIIGINNRDLSTFRTELDTTLRLIEAVPDDALVVSESGIADPEDVVLLGDAGVDAVLVGEALLRASDPGRAAEALCAAPRRERLRV
jgi:indole-3-glycerol phosphate synthase